VAEPTKSSERRAEKARLRRLAEECRKAGILKNVPVEAVWAALDAAGDGDPRCAVPEAEAGRMAARLYLTSGGRPTLRPPAVSTEPAARDWWAEPAWGYLRWQGAGHEDALAARLPWAWIDYERVVSLDVADAKAARGAADPAALPDVRPPFGPFSDGPPPARGRGPREATRLPSARRVFWWPGLRAAVQFLGVNPDKYLVAVTPAAFAAVWFDPADRRVSGLGEPPALPAGVVTFPPEYREPLAQIAAAAGFITPAQLAEFTAGFGEAALRVSGLDEPPALPAGVARAATARTAAYLVAAAMGAADGCAPGESAGDP